MQSITAKAARDLERVLDQHPVVLLMKGTRERPRCGRSGGIVDLLDDYLDDYQTIDAGRDEALREVLADRTGDRDLPQLFVRGEHIGNESTLRRLHRERLLASKLGSQRRAPSSPELLLTEAARQKLMEVAAATEPSAQARPSLCLDLRIDRDFHHELVVQPNGRAAPADDVVDVVVDGFRFRMDHPTARRADGLAIDWHESADIVGFVMSNPNEPQSPRRVDRRTLSEWLRSHKAVEIFALADGGTEAAAPTEAIAQRQRPLDEAGRALLANLDRGHAVVLTGGSTAERFAAARHCLGAGFAEVFCLDGDEPS